MYYVILHQVKDNVRTYITGNAMHHISILISSIRFSTFPTRHDIYNVQRNKSSEVTYDTRLYTYQSSEVVYVYPHIHIYIYIL